MKIAWSIVLAVAFFAGIASAQDAAPPKPGAVDAKPFMESYAPPPTRSDRAFFSVARTERGTTKEIPEEVIVRLCSGQDGCSIRLGMHNWDDTGRVASRQTLLFYNKDTGVWRAENDSVGSNMNSVTEHVLHAWGCIFTDGEYVDWQDKGDLKRSFSLLSWNSHNADCYLTITN